MDVLLVEAVKAITKLVATRPMEQVKLAWMWKDQFEKLQKELTHIQAFLLDLENRETRWDSTTGSHVVSAWLKRVLDLAYCADDVMDECAFEVLRRRSNSWELVNKFKRNESNSSDCHERMKLMSFMMKQKESLKKYCYLLRISDTNPVAFRFKMSDKINRILRKFDVLYKDAAKLGIRPSEMASVSVGDYDSVSRVKISSNLDEVRELAVANRFEFVRRQNDQEKLVKSLCDLNNREEISIIAIVGMGGQGKTTLARHVYENEVVVKHFQRRFWICVSDNFPIKRILCEIFERLTRSKCELSNTENIIESTQQRLRGKRYLLVLDDVWDTYKSKWNSLKNSLQRIGGSRGSMILVTTRSKDIAETAETRYMHQLRGLSDEESWAFFKQKALPKETVAFNPAFEDIGKSIVRKCKGLPLAIDVIGGLLRTKKDVCEWESIEKSKIWSLPKENNDIIHPSLLLSYNHLHSSSMKQCFAYCAIFPKDALIDREDLINLWNAQGFLHSQCKGANQSPEELGGQYFDILLNNSLLQVERQYPFCGNIVMEFIMHDLVHDLALYVSKHDWLIWKGLDSISDHSSSQHLTILPEGDDTVTLEFPAEKLHHFWTLHSWIDLLPRDLFMHARNLRVLKLAPIGLKEVPESIGLLSHLRYLDLSNIPIVKLPDSLTMLHHLQTFRILSRELKELPTKMYRLTNLRHLYLMFRSWCLPGGVEKLTDLQTVPKLKLLEKQGWQIGELRDLKDIKGLLSISGLEHVKSKEQAQEARIRHKTGISELQLTWGYGSSNNHLDVLDCLQPHQNLRSLTIVGYDGLVFPPWISARFQSLVSIELLYCRMCLRLPTLGHLPCLRELSMTFMWSVEYIGQEFYFHHSSHDVVRQGVTYFAELRTLNICNFERLIEWTLPFNNSASAFPLLETLRIEQCDKLVTTPTYFPSLQNLWVDENLKTLFHHPGNSQLNSSSSFPFS